MAAPVLSNVQLPDDAANTGKKVQTQSESVGGVTVHAHYFIPRSKRKILGLYNAMHAVQSVQAAAQNLTSSGFWWLQAPAAITTRARLRRLELAFTNVGEADMLSVPRIALARFTFSGTASGTELVGLGKRKSSDPTNAIKMRTAPTGMTIAGDGHAWGIVVPTLALTTSGLAWCAGPVVQWAPTDEEEFIDIGAGEGLALYQPDAGTAADSRRFSCVAEWDEYDAG